MAPFLFHERGSLSNAPNPRAKKARRMRAAHLIRCTLGGDCFAQGGGFFYVGRVPSPSNPDPRKRAAYSLNHDLHKSAAAHAGVGAARPRMDDGS